jgi:hypothetical protein
MAKTHYATRDRANESNNHDEWHRTFCGLEETESPLSDNILEVNCKKCLKQYNKQYMSKDRFYAPYIIYKITENGWEVAENRGTTLFARIKE